MTIERVTLWRDKREGYYCWRIHFRGAGALGGYGFASWLAAHADLRKSLAQYRKEGD